MESEDLRSLRPVLKQHTRAIYEPLTSSVAPRPFAKLTATMPSPDDPPELSLRDAAATGARRSLYSNDGFQSHLVDSSGVAYEPYSLAWRYLGLYIDCELEGATNFYEYYDHGRRKLQEGEDDDGRCRRKLLWAAYVDPKYRGNAVEEYQFYDLKNGTWDDSACSASGTSRRCARMDCHESWTHFKLVGVFKETRGMYDWTEQLFKHEGYCIWQGEEDEGVYDTMEEWMEKWPQKCKQLSMKDYYGNTLYVDVHPLPEGNMTLEVYTDDKCTVLSEEMDLQSYIIMLYSYYGYNQRGQEVAQTYADAIDTWNEKMSVFKLCQPCRAYNLFYDRNKDGHGHRHRGLGGNEKDGEGEERERYNCYDDAGYTNVNQCYKFETKTRLEPAEEYDLRLASDQGTILMIKANGTTYGSGGYTSSYAPAWEWDWDFDIMKLGFDKIDPERMMYLSFGSIALVWISLLLFFHNRHRRNCRKADGSLASSFCDDDNGGEYDSDSSGSTRASERSKRSIYLPPSLEMTNTGNFAPDGVGCGAQGVGCGAQNAVSGIDPSPSASSNSDTFADYTVDDSTMDGTGKYRRIGYVNYSGRSQSEGKSCEKSPGSIQADSQDEASLNIDSSRTEFLFDLEAIDESRSEEEPTKNMARPDIATTPSDISSCASIDDRANRMKQWHARQHELARKQTPGLQPARPQIPENAKEEDELGDALQRVQRRIVMDEQNRRESLGHETAAASRMSSIV